MMQYTGNGITVFLPSLRLMEIVVKEFFLNLNWPYIHSGSYLDAAVLYIAVG